MLEPRLPDWVAPLWWASREEAERFAPDIEIGWFDMFEWADMLPAMRAATQMKWLNSIYAGIDWMPIDLFKARGVRVTNGVGINAVTIAEYVIMGMLTVAKGYDDVLRARDRHEWLADSPGKLELADTKALILGAGAIGSLTATRLRAFDVEVTTVRRTPGRGDLGPNEWRARLGEFDWVILAVPATPETEKMIGADELAAMKSTATLVNIARGSVVDQNALVTALTEESIAHAFLDVTTPEPLPADHPLWRLPNAHITMHLSGPSQTKMFTRSADRFVENLGRWHRGEPLIAEVDLAAGY